MSFRFDPKQGLVIVRAELTGPTSTAVLRLALDTGATSTLINEGMLVEIGYNPALIEERMPVTMGSGVVYAPRVPLQIIRALGQTRNDLAVLAYTLPPSASVDGLLGLDFFRGKRLTIHFQTGRIDVK